MAHTRTIVDPNYGFRLSGKLGLPNTFAAIYARDYQPDDAAREHPDFSVFRFKHALKEDSYIGAFYTGRDGGRIQPGRRRDGRIRLSPTDVASFHLFGSFSKDPGAEPRAGHALGPAI